MMKFRIEKNGVLYELENSDLRAGRVVARQLNDAGEHAGEVVELVSSNQFQQIVDAYIDRMVKHGVRRFVFSFEEAGDVVFYSLRPSQVKTLAKSLYSLNTAGGKHSLLALSFRATKIEKAVLKEYGELVDSAAAVAFHAIAEANNGFRGEARLYGKSQPKATSSDGKVLLPSGKKASSQLKTSARNSSRSLSKTHNIWVADEGIPNT